MNARRPTPKRPTPKRPTLMQVLFNPRCSKCRTLKKAFDENEVDWQKVLYLEGALTREMIR